MKSFHQYTNPLRLISITCLINISFVNVAMGDETKWIAVGNLHDWYSSAGSEIEVGRTHQIPDQQDGLRWPAQYEWQDTKAAKALWIGATDYYDPLVGQTFDYKVIHVGPRVLNEVNEIMPQEFRLIGRFDHPTVLVDGFPSSDMIHMDVVDEIAPTLAADRLLYNVVNTAIGITMTRKIYAFTNQNHNNYFIYDYVFKNTGVIDNQGTFYQQTLDSLMFFFQYRYAIAKEACSYGYSWLPQSATWGRNTMNDVIGEDPNSNDPFRALYSWHGLHSGAGFDNIGGPNAWGDGRLGAAQYVGVNTIHADLSNADHSDDPYQPTTTMYQDSDGPIQSGNDQFNALKMTAEYAAMTAGHPLLSHAEEVGDLPANDFGPTGGGYSQTQGFGPYTLAPGDSIHIVLAEGVSGLKRTLCYSIGDEWLNGSAPYTLPDGSTTDDADEFKNSWVYTGQDSILQTFQRAMDNYNSGFTIPQPPPPPAIFEVISDTNQIVLSWDDNAESHPNFAGYKIYRAIHRSDTAFVEIYDGPAGINQFSDTTPIQGFDYYYYIISYDDGSTNDIEPGVPLRSSLFWTRTSHPAFLRDVPVFNADIYVDPAGNDENSGLTPDDPFLTITAAINRIAISSLNPNTIYLSEGTYSPSSNGEDYPLNWKSFVNLSGIGATTTILDAEGQSGILSSINVNEFLIENLTIRNGAADQGGGIYCSASNPILSNVTISENSANNSGGGISVIDNSTLTLSNVTIKENYAGNRGGGIYISENSSMSLDSVNRCNILLNTAGTVGYDLSSNMTIFGAAPAFHLIVDTFTVMYPNDYYAYPSEVFMPDIFNGVVDQIEADLYVAPSGDNNNSGLAPDDPFQTITHAFEKIIADSIHPHIIYLAEGNYGPYTNGENYPLYGRSYLSLSGAGEGLTILDAEEESRIFYFDNDSDLMIENLTISNGVGGMHLQRYSDIALTNVTISDNSANSGGGIYCNFFSTVSLNKVTVKNNTANWYGGGICLTFGSVAYFDSINRCNIFSNSANDSGNDLYTSGDAPTINVVLDTFTVLYPTEEYASPLDNYTFDIMNYKIYQAEADLYVDPAGNDENSGLAPESPLQTITQALAVIFADSTRPHAIHLSEGTYSPSTTGESYPLNCKSYVSLEGTDEEMTILAAEGQSGVLYCFNASELRIENLTVMNGMTDYGGGLYCEESSPIISNVSFTGNSANSGGAIYCVTNSNPILREVTIHNNSSEKGGGIYCESASPSLESVLIAENTAGTHGGGIYCMTNSNLIIDNVTLSQNNAASRGGGIYCSESDPVLKSVIIMENSARYGGGIYCTSSSNPVLASVTITGNTASSRGGGINSAQYSSPTIINSILWSDVPDEIRDPMGLINVFFTDVHSGWDGEGNIDADPLFTDAENGDFNLQEGSPCIDAGIDFFVLNGDTLANIPSTLFNGNAPDMGAIESEFFAAIRDQVVLPTEFVLYQNYPNPFNPLTTIRYQLPFATDVQLVVFDMLGRYLITLVDKHMEPGYKMVIWDGKNEFGRNIGSGMYFYQIKADKFVQTRKMVLLK